MASKRRSQVGDTALILFVISAMAAVALAFIAGLLGIVHVIWWLL